MDLSLGVAWLIYTSLWWFHWSVGLAASGVAIISTLKAQRTDSSSSVFEVGGACVTINQDCETQCFDQASSRRLTVRTAIVH